MPNGQKPSYNHHYVPQVYLHNFTAISGRLCGLNLRTSTPFALARPKDVAAYTDFHNDPDWEPINQLESDLGKRYEGPAGHLLRSVLSKTRLTAAGLHGRPGITRQEHWQLAQFAALQLIRTPKMRDQMEARASRYRTPKVSLTNKELAKGAHLRIIRSHMEAGFSWFGGAIARHRLVLLVAPRGSVFWTSDAPVAVTENIGGTLSLKDPALKSDRLELYLPLSSDVTAMFVGPHFQRPHTCYRLTPDEVAHHNELTRRNAYHYLYGAEPF
ncbi:DUF4238 domain-containing protein [Deinococcus sp. 12RED42]|uniref:DUF4238 domain-containing protein n=1 Tax=Deinococcus sp. 12RED42 TaxID=2745872 RepID=UPI001E50D264|nr:DUF4238 domain-containing protein [Deinococcus sp. 12RED42]MCD0166364.1 DUF4238 domain-containing protein [Deinococcus sp. 12RED42]